MNFSRYFYKDKDILEVRSVVYTNPMSTSISLSEASYFLVDGKKFSTLDEAKYYINFINFPNKLNEALDEKEQKKDTKK